MPVEIRNNIPRLVRRVGLIIADTLQPSVGQNINGPTCVEMPDWFTARLGRFHLYFADHLGKYIKLAFCDTVDGQWSIAGSQALDLRYFKDAYDHIASPDVLLDEERQLLILYFHARARSKGREQWTFAMCLDKNGRVVEIIDVPLAPFYLRVFRHNGEVFGLSKGGLCWRSPDGLTPFSRGTNIINPNRSDDLWQNQNGDVRHVAVDLRGTNLDVYFTRIGDKPERIFWGTVDISEKDWKSWAMGEVTELMRPEEEYEGVNTPLTPSHSGPSLQMENALRDPFFFRLDDKKYLFYSVAGEKGIGLAKLR